MPDQWSLYLIRCADTSLYCGISNNVARRFKEHQSGSKKSAKYLRGRGPLKIVFQCEIGDRSLASQAEAMFKTLKKSEKEQVVAAQDLSLFIEIQT